MRTNEEILNPTPIEYDMKIKLEDNLNMKSADMVVSNDNLSLNTDGEFKSEKSSLFSVVLKPIILNDKGRHLQTKLSSHQLEPPEDDHKNTRNEDYVDYTVPIGVNTDIGVDIKDSDILGVRCKQNHLICS